MSLVQIKVEYDYYSKKRVTPVYMREEEILNTNFDQFKRRLLTEVPHLNKIVGSLRLTVKDKEIEVDLSSTYFNVQIKGILAEEKVINIKAIEFNSPAVNTPCTSDTGTQDGSRSEGTKNIDDSMRPNRVRRSLSLHFSEQDTLPSLHDSCEKSHESPVLLSPLERYALKQKETVKNITLDLEKKRHKLVKIDDKLKRASVQNGGHLSSCGNCHLKLGHTKKVCTFSACTSAYSCGLLSKHSDEKTKRAAVAKEITRIQGQLATAKREIENTSHAADKVMHSVSKRIEDVMVDELPNRYTSGGLRNWVLLNKDVAMVQKHLRGKLPSRENVKELLHEVVIQGSVDKVKYQSTSCSSTCTSSKALQSTDHRMKPQKRLLSEEYAITFPTEKKSCEVTCILKSNTSNLPSSTQEQNDFKLALKLQQQEMESHEEDSSLFQESAQINEEKTDSVVEEPDLEFQANAAAALLELQRREFSQS